MENVLDKVDYNYKNGEKLWEVWEVVLAKDYAEVDAEVKARIADYHTEVDKLYSKELVDEVNKYKIVTTSEGATYTDVVINAENRGPRVALLGTGWDDQVHMHITDSIIIDGKMCVCASLFESFTLYAN